MKLKHLILTLYLALMGLSACSTEGTEDDSGSKVKSIEQIEREAGMPEEQEAADEGVVPVVYTGADKELADQAPEGMVFIKGGCFTMGTNNAQTDEKYAHKVCLDDFYMDKHEVTQERWEKVMGYNPSKFPGANRPVEQVNYYDIQKFIKKSGGTCRLPTEAEWEYAAGGAKVRSRYYWGNLMDGEYAWYVDNSEETTHEVGQKKPNQFGLHDMMGNVWEWTDDWYHSRFERTEKKNPKGPQGGEYRVIRGGAMDSSAGALRITNRTWLHPKNRVYSKITTYGGIVNEIFNYIGFRCAQSVKQNSPEKEPEESASQPAEAKPE